ncbi:MAG: sel1 repeat family protein [Alphaproteobacteria bacterium]|nr:sel1 repeat family protein [Alphaproteobacteria bacterium]MBU1550764.1 sel1 repeat family protein [Alphaproteobacteria bacterium]MBU2338900.1 sel1 repeat family protein [Alphaproteobacteria bacterium]MBU2386991.1 sel1 repeat family protein [Alphaproteobacteria bacterium]
MKLTFLVASLILATPLSAVAQSAAGQQVPSMPMAEIKAIIAEQQTARSSEAISSLEALAEQGNAEALMLLGDIFANGTLAQVDGAKAVDFYQRSIDAGAKFARYKLAEIYRLGDIIPEDESKAAELYQVSADEGLAPAKVRLGLAYIHGEGVDADVDRGVAMLQEAAEAGDQMAMNTLGNLYSSAEGPVQADNPQALQYFERSADAGNAFAMLKLGSVYLSGTLDDSDPEKAMMYLQRASEAGVQQADVMIANGHIEGRFGSASNPSEGIGKLEELAEQGSSEARASLADVYYFGRSTIKDPTKAVDILQVAANEGDVLAAQRLIYFYRDAPAKGVAKDVGKAKEIFERVAAEMPPSVAARERVLLAAASASGRQSLSAVTDLLNEVPESDQSVVIAALRFTNPNAFVYVAQSRLQERGAYSGPLNGLLTSSTIRAINTICVSDCRLGPLNPESVRNISRALAERP